MSSSAPITKAPRPGGSFQSGLWTALPVAAALVYGLGHLAWYLGTPLGRVPVLDERENLDLGAAIAGGTLPAVPFYRAQGYALVLACLQWSGVPPAGIFSAALLLGVGLHAACTLLVARLSGRWFGDRAALAAGLLFALNPVMVHFATQAVDATLGLALFLAGFDLLVRAREAAARPGPWAGSSFFWAGATLVRPNYLLSWALAPAFTAFLPAGWRRPACLLAALLPAALLFGAASAWQARVSGVPGFMPWQGAYNLWAANRPGANGRYFTQRVSLPPELARANPARAESILEYAEETHGLAPEIPAMNAHWRARFAGEVLGHPLRWGALMARKAYALANTWEQYNNKTFAFHKALSPWLRWNPLGWGVVLVLGVAGAARLAAERPDAAWTLAAAGASCAASVILFFVSARFRLPLAALLTVLAGGAVAAPGFWRGWTAAHRAWLLSCLALAAFVAFSRFDGVDDRSTFVQDHVLLARAAFTVGDDETALSEAREALRMQPWHPDAAAIADAAAAELARRRNPP